MSVFITISAKTYEELMWRKQQMVDMLKSMDYVCERLQISTGNSTPFGNAVLEDSPFP